MKRTIALLLAVILVLGCAGTYMYHDYKRAKATVEGGEDEKVAEDDYSEYLPETAEAAEKSDKDSKSSKSSKKAGEKTSSKSTEVASTNEAKDGELSYYILPTSAKQEFTGAKFNLVKDNMEDFYAKYPDRTFNWHSYSKFTNKRRKARIEAVKTGWRWGDVDCPNQASDFVSIRLHGDTPKQMYKNFKIDLTQNPAFAVGWADFLATHILFEDGDTLGNVIPTLRQFVKDDRKALKNADKWYKLYSKWSFETDEATRKKLEEKMAKLEGQRGTEHWLETGENGDPLVNEVFGTYCRVLINTFDIFELYEGGNLLTVDSTVNYYLPSTGDDIRVKVVENKHYQEENQQILPLVYRDKNGTVLVKFGPNKWDSRPVKALERSRYIAKHTKKRASTPPRRTTTQQRQRTPEPDNQETEEVVRDEEPEDEDIDDDEVVYRERIHSSKGDSNNSNPPRNNPSNPSKPDGRGGKDQSQSSAYQGNAPDLSGNNTKDGDGVKESKPAQTNTTVYEGGEGSGRRSVTDYDSGYKTSAENNYGHATNGSTESSDSSYRESSGSTDSSGATVDNNISSSNDSVSEAPRESSTPTEAASSGFTLDASMGD